MIDEARCPSCSGNVCESERTPGQSQVRTWMKEQTLAFRLTNISHNTAKKGRGDVSGCHLIRKGCLPCDTRKIDFLRVTAAARCPLLPFEAFAHNTCIWKFSILYTEGAHAGVNFLCPGFWCLARVGGKSTIGFGQRVSALRHCVCRRPRVHAGIFGHNAPIDDLCCVSRVVAVVYLAWRLGYVLWLLLTYRPRICATGARPPLNLQVVQSCNALLRMIIPISVLVFHFI